MTNNYVKKAASPAKVEIPGYGINQLDVGANHIFVLRFQGTLLSF